MKFDTLRDRITAAGLVDPTRFSARTTDVLAMRLMRLRVRKASVPDPALAMQLYLSEATEASVAFDLHSLQYRQAGWPRTIDGLCLFAADSL